MEGSLYRGPGGVLPKKLGRGVRPASQNPYPIYDQNLWFSVPYLWPDQKFDTLFMTWPINTLFQTCLIIISLVQTSVKGNVYLLLLGRLQDYMCKEVASSKKYEFKTRVQKSVPWFITTMAIIDTPFMTKTAEKTYPLGPHIPI